MWQDVTEVIYCVVVLCMSGRDCVVGCDGGYLLCGCAVYEWTGLCGRINGGHVLCGNAVYEWAGLCGRM